MIVFDLWQIPVILVFRVLMNRCDQCQGDSYLFVNKFVPIKGVSIR